MSGVSAVASRPRLVAAVAGWHDRAWRWGGWRRDVTALGAGAVSILAFAPFHLGAVLLLTLPTLVWMIDATVVGPSPVMSLARRAIAAGRVGWMFGFGYHAVGLYWIGEAFLVEAEVFAWLLPFAVTLLPAGLALFWAGACAAAALVWRPGWSRVLVLALAVAAAEWLRGHVLTGLPWNILGYALTWPLVLMQSAGLLGIYGLTLAAVFVLATPLVALLDCDGSTRRSMGPVAAAIVVLGALLLYGTLRLAEHDPPAVAGARVRIVQPSIPQRDKWRPERQLEFFRDHLALSGQDASGREDGFAGITHVIWPEAAMPFQPLRTPQALELIAERLPPGVALLSGALRSDEPPPGETRRRAYNSLMVFDEAARLTALYDKIHLVPFGEYLPWQSTLESLGFEQLTRQRGGFTPGPSPRPTLAVAGLPEIGPLICYEAIFPAAVVQGGSRPGVLVNVTNDGWFGTGTGPRQHLHQARVRAVEEGLPLLRAANNGISAIVDGKGRLIAWLGLDRRGSIDGALPGAMPPPLYARVGDGAFAVLWVSLATLATWLGLARRAEPRPD